MPLTRKGHTACYLFLALSSAVVAFVLFLVLTPVHVAIIYTKIRPKTASNNHYPHTWVH